MSIRIKKSEVVVRSCSANKVFLKISQNSQENTCAVVKVAGLKVKRDSSTGVFQLISRKF